MKTIGRCLAFAASALVAGTMADAGAGVFMEDMLTPLPPGAVRLSGGLAVPIAKSIDKWHKGNVPYHEFAAFFVKGRPKFALGERCYYIIGFIIISSNNLYPK